MATAGGAWRQAASNLLDVLKEMDIGQIFAKPVNQQIYRDYSQYVSQPMDLGLVRQKLPSYRNAKQFATDVRLVFSNALAYCGRVDATENRFQVHGNVTGVDGVPRRRRRRESATNKTFQPEDVAAGRPRRHPQTITALRPGLVRRVAEPGEERRSLFIFVFRGPRAGRGFWGCDADGDVRRPGPARRFIKLRAERHGLRVLRPASFCLFEHHRRDCSTAWRGATRNAVDAPQRDSVDGV